MTIKEHDFQNEESACFIVKTTAVANGVDILNGKEEVRITVTEDTISIHVVRENDEDENENILLFSTIKGQLQECKIYDPKSDIKKPVKRKR